MPRGYTATQTQQSRRREQFALSEQTYRGIHAKASADKPPRRKWEYLRDHDVVPAAITISTTEVKVPSLTQVGAYHTVNPVLGRCTCPATRRCWHIACAEDAATAAFATGTEAQRQEAMRRIEERAGMRLFRTTGRAS